MGQSSISILAFALMAGAVMGQDWAKARLEKSPRHLEWVKVKNGDRVVNCFIAYPQAKDPATAVLLIHERLGLSARAKINSDLVSGRWCNSNRAICWA